LDKQIPDIAERPSPECFCVQNDAHEPPTTPLPYDHGLSYTDFAYRDLSVSAATVGPEEPVTATVTVENVGDRQGTDVVEVFVTDELSSRVTPVRDLGGYE
jgi:beta-glucosidase